MTLFGLSAVVFAKVITKVSNFIKKSERIVKLVDKLGGIKTLFQVIEKAAKRVIEGRVGKYLSAAQLTALIGLADLGLNTIADIAGVGSCWSMIRALW